MISVTDCIDDAEAVRNDHSAVLQLSGLSSDSTSSASAASVPQTQQDLHRQGRQVSEDSVTVQQLLALINADGSHAVEPSTSGSEPSATDGLVLIASLVPREVEAASESSDPTTRNDVSLAATKPVASNTTVGETVPPETPPVNDSTPTSVGGGAVTQSNSLSRSDNVWGESTVRRRLFACLTDSRNPPAEVTIEASSPTGADAVSPLAPAARLARQLSTTKPSAPRSPYSHTQQVLSGGPPQGSSSLRGRLLSRERRIATGTSHGGGGFQVEVVKEVGDRRGRQSSRGSGPRPRASSSEASSLQRRSSCGTDSSTTGHRCRAHSPQYSSPADVEQHEAEKRSHIATFLLSLLWGAMRDCQCTALRLVEGAHRRCLVREQAEGFQGLAAMQSIDLFQRLSDDLIRRRGLHMSHLQRAIEHAPAGTGILEASTKFHQALTALQREASGGLRASRSQEQKSQLGSQQRRGRPHAPVRPRLALEAPPTPGAVTSGHFVGHEPRRPATRSGSCGSAAAVPRWFKGVGGAVQPPRGSTNIVSSPASTHSSGVLTSTESSPASSPFVRTFRSHCPSTSQGRRARSLSSARASLYSGDRRVQGSSGDTSLHSSAPGGYSVSSSGLLVNLQLLFERNTEPGQKTRMIAPDVNCTPSSASKVLAAAGIQDSDVVYDIGCGSGDLMLQVLRYNTQVRCVGVEIRSNKAKEAHLRVSRGGFGDRATVRHDDAMAVDISDATVVLLYLIPGAMRAMGNKLKGECKPGTRIVSLLFEFPGWRKCEDRSAPGVHAYIVGET